MELTKLSNHGTCVYCFTPITLYVVNKDALENVDTMWRHDTEVPKRPVPARCNIDMPPLPITPGMLK